LMRLFGGIPDALDKQGKAHSFVEATPKRMVTFRVGSAVRTDTLMQLEAVPIQSVVKTSLTLQQWIECVQENPALEKVLYVSHDEQICGYGVVVDPRQYPRVEGGYWQLMQFISARKRLEFIQSEYALGNMFPKKLGAWAVLTGNSERLMVVDKDLTDGKSLMGSFLSRKSDLAHFEQGSFGVRQSAKRYWQTWCDFTCSLIFGATIRVVSAILPRKGEASDDKGGFVVGCYYGMQCLYTAISDVPCGHLLKTGVDVGCGMMVCQKQTGLTLRSIVFGEVPDRYEYDLPVGKFWSAMPENNRAVLTNLQLPDCDDVAY